MSKIVQKGEILGLLKVLYVAEERTARGRLFHALGPATANARSPIVDRRVAGMTSRDKSTK